MSQLPQRETARAAAAFERYAALGPGRSLRKLAKIMAEEADQDTAGIRQTRAKDTSERAEIIRRQLQLWSTAHRWQERVKAYDRERALELAAERQEKIRQLNEKHTQIARTQTLRAIKEIEHLASVHKLTGQAAVSLFKYAVDLERVAMGIPTQVTEETETIPPETHDESDNIARAIRQDPESTRLWCLLFDRITLGSTGRRPNIGLEYYLSQRRALWASVDEEPGASVDSDPSASGVSGAR